MRPLIGRILASFLRLVADVFSPHPIETISRPFSAALGPQVSKPTFGGAGVSDCAVRRNHLSVLASPSDVNVARFGLLFAQVQAQAHPFHLAFRLASLQRVPGPPPAELFFRKALDSCERLMRTPS